MKKTLTILFILVFNYTYKAQQNLVPNGSFEDTLGCPMFSNELFKCKNWFNPSVFSSPDYFNNCDLTDGVSVPKNFGGYQNAFSGKAYVGIITYYYNSNSYREFIGTKLLETLVQGLSYKLSLRVSLGDSSHYAINNLGFGFYSDTIGTDKPILKPNNINQLSNLFISDKADWILLTKVFKAIGNEKYLILGNFNDDSNTTITNLGNGGLNGDYYSSYYYIDSINLQKYNSNISISDFEINLITPNNDGHNDNIDFSRFNIQKLNFTVYNRWGNCIYKSNDPMLIWNGRNQDNKELPTGTYFYCMDVIQNNEHISKHSFIQIIN